MNTNDLKKTTKTSILKYITLLILICIAMLALYYNYDKIKSACDFHYDKKNVIKPEEVKHESKSYDTELDNQLTNPSPPIKYYHTIQNKGIIDEIINNKDKTIATALLAYRNYLFNINDMLFNFMQGTPYTMQIKKVRIIPLPQNVEAIITNLERYNMDYLLNPNINITRIFPLNSGIIEKFIIIDQLSNSITKSQANLKELILSGLNILNSFIYSEDLQNIFINNQVK